jgi:hypothetical protein
VSGTGCRRRPPGPLFAVLRLAATVDPRLAEPLRLLAEVGARDTTDGHAGQLFADLPKTLDRARSL